MYFHCFCIEGYDAVVANQKGVRIARGPLHALQIPEFVNICQVILLCPAPANGGGGIQWLQ